MRLFSRPWFLLPGALAYVAIAGAEPVQRTAAESEPALTIRLYDHFGALRERLEQGITEATRIFREAGIRTTWVLCPCLEADSPTEPGAGQPVGPADLTLRLLPDPSSFVRQYLWAHREDTVATARRLVEILPGDALRRILKYLVESYWARYTGWPDLLVYDGDSFFFTEVKGSRDKLREDQKRWIEANATELKLPFKLVRLHRASAPAKA